MFARCSREALEAMSRSTTFTFPRHWGPVGQCGVGHVFEPSSIPGTFAYFFSTEKTLFASNSALVRAHCHPERARGSMREIRHAAFAVM